MKKKIQYALMALSLVTLSQPVVASETGPFARGKKILPNIAMSVFYRTVKDPWKTLEAEYISTESKAVHMILYLLMMYGGYKWFVEPIWKRLNPGKTAPETTEEMVEDITVKLEAKVETQEAKAALTTAIIETAEAIEHEGIAATEQQEAVNAIKKALVETKEAEGAIERASSRQRRKPTARIRRR